VRLTFHPGWDRVIDWQPDGEAIRFQSARESHTGRDLQLYTVARTGGLPVRMILPTAGLSSYAPDGHRIAYTPTSTETRTWKRYKGGWAQDIWIYDLAANTSRQVTDWVGTDNFPMWHGDTIYYTSDREAGKLNLWAYDTVGSTATARSPGTTSTTSSSPASATARSSTRTAAGYGCSTSPRSRRATAGRPAQRPGLGEAAAPERRRPDARRQHLARRQARGGRRPRRDLQRAGREGPVRNLTATPGVRERAGLVARRQAGGLRRRRDRRVRDLSAPRRRHR
jgi:hypothetical protein